MHIDMHIVPAHFLLVGTLLVVGVTYFLVEMGNRKQLSPGRLMAVRATTTLLLCFSSFIVGCLYAANVLGG